MMNNNLLGQLLEIRKLIVRAEGKETKYRLVSFKDSTLSKDAIPGTPFRWFESVPQGRISKRKQNDTMSFDPYIDTVFDYPMIVNASLGGTHEAIIDLNWHLTLQVPFCGMNCWHCYNDKSACKAGIGDVLEITGETNPVELTAKHILDLFASCRKQGQSIGRIYNVLRVSGGEPFLAIELIAELIQLIVNNRNAENGNPDYPLAIWTETNLITWAESKEGSSVVKIACKEASNKGLDIQSILRDNQNILIIHPCFHGLTDQNLHTCTGNEYITIDDLYSGFRNLHSFIKTEKVAPNIFPTFIAEACDPNGVKTLFDFLYRIDTSYPLKVAVISVDDYGPLDQRITERKNQEKPIFCYAKHACLNRWNDLIKGAYGISYGQIPRPMADNVVKYNRVVEPKHVDIPEYKPVLILLKSVYRDEYRQELLTIIAAPQGLSISAAYDTRHIDSSTRICLKCGPQGFGTEPLTVLIVYVNPDSTKDEGRYLPLRWGTLKNVHVTDQLVHFGIQLNEYVTLSSVAEINSRTLENFSCNMREYFGNRTLLERPTIRWVLLGDINYLLPREEDLSISKEKAWDVLLSTIQRKFPSLMEKSIFLQVLNGSMSDSGETDLALKEGENHDFRVRYYIPKFDYYDKNSNLNEDRSLSITSADEALSVEGYSCRPLSKYGELSFSVECKDLPYKRKSTVTLESKSGSPYCPRVEVPILLKKADASGC